MALDKNDLKEIKKIVKEEINTSVSKTEAYLEDKIEFSISQSEQSLETKFEKRFDEVKQQIDGVKQEIIDNVDALAEFNRTAIEKFGTNEKTIKNHEVRIKRLEAKV